MNYKLEIFFDNLKTFFRNLKDKIVYGFKYADKKKILIRTGIAALIILLVILLIRCGSGSGGISKKEYKNTMDLAQVYADKDEYDRALALLEKLLIANPKDKKVQKLFDEILDKKKAYDNGAASASASANGNTILNPNISVDFDASDISNAMQSALDRQAAENQKVLERALAEQSRQAAENQRASQQAMEENQRALEKSQKAMAELMEKQAAQEEAKKQAEAERLEAEKAAAEQKKIEEEKRKKAEAELAKKNAKLKAEIDAVNEKIRLGKTALATGNKEEAMEYFNQAKALLPVSDGEPEFSASKESEMAQALFEASEKDGVSAADKNYYMNQAVTMANNALAANPKDAAAHNILGADALDKKDYNKALDEFKKAVLYNPNNYLYYYNLGKTQYILKKYSESVQSFTTSCRLNGQFSPSRYNLGLAQLKLKNDSQALDAFRKAIDINPRYEKAYLEQARLLSKRGDNNGSVNSYKKVLEINNVNTTALMELGSVYYADKKLSNAEESYLRALSLMQSSANYTLTSFNLSTVLFEEGKYSEAVSYAKKAYEGKDFIKDDKAKANIIYNYALMLEKTGNKDAAITTYAEVLKYDAGHNKTKINLGVMYMALTPPDAESALTLFKSVYNADPTNFEANNNLGSAYLVLEDYKHSIQYFQVALKLDPKNNDVRYNLAKAYTKDGDYATAKTVYTDLLKADNTNWDAYLELAKVCLQCNDNEGAEKYLVYLQEKNPSYKKSEVQNLLDEISK